jgi:murein L,D-transpeptidase YafK
MRPGRRVSDRPAGVRWLIICLLVLVAGSSGDAAESLPWLLVDTEALRLTVMQRGEARMSLENIAIGRYGSTPEKRRGDNMTPRGRFRVLRINTDSEFYRFIGLDYPDVRRAKQAFQAGDIGRRDLEAILDAHDRGEAPPQGTPLGGYIGIHGLGEGDPRLHEMTNWTKGCVALTDAQIDALLPWIRIGMLVEIR